VISSALSQIGSFSPKDIAIFEKAVSIKTIEKGTKLLNYNEVCKSAYFILEGAFFQHKLKDELEQNIIDLHIDNEWMVNSQSFIKQMPSETTIQAFTPSTIFEIDLHSLHALIAISPAFFQLGKVLEPQYSRLQFFDNTLSPAEKYEYILNNRPKLLQIFPLKMIASYLKVTPETLSRVREKLAKSL
jgi:CRP-like cAMP-binding protein